VRRDAESLARRGFDVTVVALQEPNQPRHERMNGIDIHRLPLTHKRGSLLNYVIEYSRLMVMVFMTVTRLYIRKRFRVIEIDNMPDVLVFSALIPKIFGAKVILYIFDNMPELYMLTRGVGARHPTVRLLGWLERVSALFADHVIVTQATARKLIRSRGVPGKKISVVLNGPDDALFTPRSRDMPPEDDPSFRVVTHGTILERFGIQILFDALPKILEEIPGARVTVYGGGEYLASLEDRACQIGIADRVTFGGWVPLDDLPTVLSDFDLGYVGMLCDNMLSNKLMEYVALGLPVVAARWPTYEHYFGDDAVRYFEAGSADALAEAVIGVYRDRRSAMQRARRAAELFEQYRWSMQQHAYYAVYERLIEKSRHHGEPVTIRQPRADAVTTDESAARATLAGYTVDSAAPT
jgi:glycosyltransferase involved in cell wall biosynthesis